MQPATLPWRPDDAHKGVFGTVGILGGQWTDTDIMIGAPSLAARAAFRSGCGRVVVVGPSKVVGPCVQMCSSATGCVLPLDQAHEVDPIGAADRVRMLDASLQAWVIGPGVGTPPWLDGMINALITGSGPPLVLDADALRCLARLEPSALLACQRALVLTPHPGEFDRLAEAWSLPISGGDQVYRVGAASAMAAACGAVVVLKGHQTVVADGEGHTWICDAGGPELATAGTGDFLAGLVAGLIAQRQDQDVASIVCLGVALHAEAGGWWRSQYGDRGMLAEELADAVPEVLKRRRMR